MLYLFLSIACSVLVGFLFKLYVRNGIQLFQAIIFNYCACVVFGSLQAMQADCRGLEGVSGWLPWAVLLGLVFIAGYLLLGLAVQHYGIAVSQILLRMSILLTVPFAILAYGETAGGLKLAGVLLALLAIVLVNWPARQGGITGGGKRYRLWIPLLTWLLAGIIELILIVVNHGKLVDTGDPAFITAVFATAGVSGLLVAVPGWLSGKLAFSWRNAAAGLLLGIPNYGTMLFMLLALGSGLEASIVFPINNMGIIIATTIGAVWLFQERLTQTNWWGFALALAAILLIACQT